jgi:bacillithiol system protein YtxJ
MSKLNWRILKSKEQLDQITAESDNNPILIFKHSTRCGISRTALDRLERNWDVSEMDHVKTYFLDLLSFRDISNEIADRFDVEHESPQLIIVEKGKAIVNKTHLAIDYASIRDAVKN